MQPHYPLTGSPPSRGYSGYSDVQALYAVASAYADQVLSQSPSLLTAITAGAADLAAIDAEALATA